MRTHRVILFALLSISVAAQTATHPTSTSAAKKPAATPAASHPTAIIDTTAGKLTCTLFPDKAPTMIDEGLHGPRAVIGIG